MTKQKRGIFSIYYSNCSKFITEAATEIFKILNTQETTKAILKCNTQQTTKTSLRSLFFS